MLNFTTMGCHRLTYWSENTALEKNKTSLKSGVDYYPFGLSFNQQTRENTQGQRYLYNDGAEREDALDLNVDFTKYRNYDPALGRWWQIDPYEKYHESPYAWVTNNPIRFNDPLGLDTLRTDSPDFIWDNVKSGDIVDDTVVLDEVVVEDDKERETELLDDKYQYDGNPKLVPYDISSIPAILPVALLDGPEIGPADVFVGGMIALILLEAIMPQNIIIPIHNPQAVYHSKGGKKNVWPDNYGPPPNVKDVDWSGSSDAELANELSNTHNDARRGPTSPNNNAKKWFRNKRPN